MVQKNHTSLLGASVKCVSYPPLMMSSANVLMDLVSDRSSFLMTTFSFPVSSKMSVRASSALSRSRHAMMMRAPGKTIVRMFNYITSQHRLFWLWILLPVLPVQLSLSQKQKLWVSTSFPAFSFLFPCDACWVRPLITLTLSEVK